MDKEEKKRGRNRASRIRGANFEQMIVRACEEYKTEGAAAISKVPEPRKVIGRTGGRSSQMICVNAEKAHPDFLGTIAGGRSVTFDAKHTDKDRILQGAVTEHQAELLDLHEAMGALCWVVVDFNFEATFRVPWDFWKAMKERVGRKYLSPDDAEILPYRVPVTATEEGDSVRFLDIGGAV